LRRRRASARAVWMRVNSVSSVRWRRMLSCRGGGWTGRRPRRVSRSGQQNQPAGRCPVRFAAAQTAARAPAAQAWAARAHRAVLRQFELC
jgi:hypothetical protein